MKILVALLGLIITTGAYCDEEYEEYTEEEYVIRGSVLQNLDLMDYYAALAKEGDTRALYIMAALIIAPDKLNLYQ